MIIKKIVKKILSKLNLSTYGVIRKKKILEIINLLRPEDLGYKYQRIGGKTDGSYVVPEIIKEMNYCFSAGYGGDCSFEKELEKYYIKSFLADYSFDAPKELKNFEYTKKFIKSFSDQKSIDINSWIEKKTLDDQKKMILQIDIEGSEYEVIHAISEKNLKRFDILIIEMHNLFMLNNQIFHKYFLSCIEKIRTFFDVFYLQPNNCCGTSNFNGVVFPNVLEITFLNKSKVKYKENFKDENKNLFVKNIKNKKEIILPNYWY